MATLYHNISGELVQELVAPGDNITVNRISLANIQKVSNCKADLYIEKRLTGRYQVEFNEDVDGIPLKGFLDCLGDGYITDSKSSRSVDKFRYDVNSFCYDIQAYIYTKVFGIKDYYWVVQEKAYPYYPAEVKCSEETLFKGEMKFHQALENIHNYLDKGLPEQDCYASFTV